MNKLATLLGQTVLSQLLKDMETADLESDDSPLTPQEVEDLEAIQEAFAKLRKSLTEIHVRSGPDLLTRLHLQQCLARLSEAEMWAERVVLE